MGVCRIRSKTEPHKTVQAQSLKDTKLLRNSSKVLFPQQMCHQGTDSIRLEELHQPPFVGHWLFKFSVLSCKRGPLITWSWSLILRR